MAPTCIMLQQNKKKDINAAKLEGIISKLGTLRNLREWISTKNYNNLARMMQPTCSIQGSLPSLCSILFTQLIVIITIILCSPTGVNLH